ncbi:MAG: hypothetical protein JWN38_545 [Candidatus Saccharibacteria bacterium]|nr:hypothetical protein [Candidatus Saccharibacteria bacterium]
MRRGGASAAIRSGVTYLRGQQANDGSFLGQASTAPDDFRDSQLHYTAFFTSLIASVLHTVPGTVRLRNKAVTFLLLQKTPEWTWNYWLPGSIDDQTRPYPDDLDDTACALSAISLTKPALIDGRVLGFVAKQLISQETKPSGPYTTWLVREPAEPIWKDVDAAVNANIGYFLSLHDVTLKGLEGYLEDCLRRSDLRSPYYYGQAPTLYFLARWYRGPQLPRLQQLITQQLAAKTTPLQLALLVLAGCHAGVPRAALQAAHQLLLDSQTDGHWPASAFYNEPPRQGQNWYAGSTALTTAFAVAALGLYAEFGRAVAPVAHTAASNSTPKPASDLAQLYADYVARLTAGDREGSITAIASSFATACQRPVSQATVDHCNRASLNGWVAYTIYDDIMDDAKDRHLLGVANFAQRQLIGEFRAAVPGNTAFAAEVQAALDTMDSVNTWEAQHARADVSNGLLQLPPLPDYHDLSTLADRSWGHSLAASGVLHSLGLTAESPEHQTLRSFFRHYLIARQLNDDAHDWEEDVAAGQLTAVVVMLLHDAGLSQAHSLVLNDQRSSLRNCFWQTTIDGVCALILDHLAQARVALAACSVLQTTTVMEGWLANLEASARQALHERNDAQAFIHTYTGI